jgi:hypothetical protein
MTGRNDRFDRPPLFESTGLVDAGHGETGEPLLLAWRPVADTPPFWREA